MKKHTTKIELIREYHKEGTNGIVIVDGWNVCDTIELPWRGNAKRISCIPEGKYYLAMYPSSKHGIRPLIQHVEGRSGILIHPANNALKELEGCIAPVTTTTGAGTGINSRVATGKLQQLISNALKDGNNVMLEITSDFGYPVF